VRLAVYLEWVQAGLSYATYCCLRMDYLQSQIFDALPHWLWTHTEAKMALAGIGAIAPGAFVALAIPTTLAQVPMALPYLLLWLVVKPCVIALVIQPLMLLSCLCLPWQLC
jgi:hypothetical protein